MTTTGRRQRPSILLAAAAAATAWFAMNAWRGLTAVPGDFLNPLLLVAIVIAGTGVATRWWHWPRAAVVAVQLAVSGMLTSLIVCGSPLPVGGAWTELTTTIERAIDSSQRYQAPVPASAPPVDVLLILGGLACLLLVDLLACTLRRVPLAGLPLLAIFSIPVGMVDGGIPWWVFVATTAGFLIMLFVQEGDQITRWGRPLGQERETGDPIVFGAGAHAVRSTAGLLGGAATAIALLVPALLPAAGWHAFDFGPGSGGGDDIKVDNPTADLVRDLKQGEDIPLIRVRTADPDPSYLRVLTLTRFSDAEWSPGDREVPSDHLADGRLPAPQGVASSIRRTEHPYRVSVLPTFDSRWLPTQPPLSRADAEGDWRYDERTMDFIAGDSDLTTASLDYTMTSVDLHLSAADLADAGTSSGKVDDIFTDLPDDLPELVRDLATQVTEGATTDYEKAVALQSWFREGGGFRYTLERANGNGTDALVAFLSDGPGGRAGYCEQFASAMAVMARALDIPARVAIGFLKPSPDGANAWVYSARDMHAWPELYFDGAGWVRFEPTPAGRAQNVPSYTVPGSTPIDDPAASPSADASNSQAPVPLRPRDSDLNATAGDDDTTIDAGSSRGPVLGSLVVIAIIAGGLLLPRTLRTRRRERRLGSGAIEPVWSELADTARDLGIPWPRGRSPRATRDAVIDHLGAPVSADTAERPPHGPSVAPAAAAALDRLVLTVELERYSRAGAPLDPVRLRADGEACVAALLGGAPRAARRRATWWPRSVFGPPRRAVPITTIETPHGGVVDNIS